VCPAAATETVKTAAAAAAGAVLICIVPTAAMTEKITQHM
jgi:hypothetical protein